MENKSLVLHLATFEAPYPVQIFIFSLCLVLYLTVTAANVMVIVTVAVTADLHKPMHIFLCNLAIADLIGSAGGIPKQLQVLLSGDTSIFYASCVAQMFILHTFAICEIFTLAIMSVDRYLAICYPLHYHTKVTAKRSILISLLSWAIAVGSVSVQVIFIVALTFQGNDVQIPGIFCDNMGISKVAVGDTKSVERYGLSLIVTHIALPLCVIVYTYIRVLVECKSCSSAEFRRKALHTFGTHFMALAVLFASIFADILVPRFVLDVASAGVINLRSAVQLAFLVSPVANVLLYCLRTSELRRAINAHFKNISHRVHFHPVINGRVLSCG